jgi:hypothetical protein
MSGKTKRCSNRAAQALRLAAAALRSGQSALGAYYRRMCARMDKPNAVTAAAHKLARLIYAMLRHGQDYTDRGRITSRSATASGSCTTSRRRPKPWGCSSSPLTTSLENTIKINQLSGVS